MLAIKYRLATNFRTRGWALYDNFIGFIQAYSYNSVFFFIDFWITKLDPSKAGR